MTINEAQKQVDQWINKHGVRYFSELTNLAVLVEEVGELSRLMARKFGDQSFKENENAEQIPDEIADIFWVLLCLANQMDVNLEDALKKSIKKKTLRDKHRHKNNWKLNS